MVSTQTKILGNRQDQSARMRDTKRKIQVECETNLTIEYKNKQSRYKQGFTNLKMEYYHGNSNSILDIVRC